MGRAISAAALRKSQRRAQNFTAIASHVPRHAGCSVAGMHRVLPRFGLALTALLVACSGSAGAEHTRSDAVSVAGAAWTKLDSASVAEGGSAEVPALSEDELRRLLDALEQEIGER